MGNIIQPQNINSQMNINKNMSQNINQKPVPSQHKPFRSHSHSIVFSDRSYSILSKSSGNNNNGKINQKYISLYSLQQHIGTELLEPQQLMQHNYVQYEQNSYLLSKYKSSINTPISSLNKTKFNSHIILTLCSTITNQKIQQYKMQFPNQIQLKKYLISYFWRKELHDIHEPIVKTKRFKIQENDKNKLKNGWKGFINRTCTGNQEIKANVYVEEVVMRLEQCKKVLKNIHESNQNNQNNNQEMNDSHANNNKKQTPHPNNFISSKLYILKQCLKGFQPIFNTLGYIHVFPDLVCLTRQGYLKVWINSDLSKNYPNIQNMEYSNINFMDNNINTENKMVKEIIFMVMKSCNDQCEGNNRVQKSNRINNKEEDNIVEFVEYLEHKGVSQNSLTFKKALQLISLYCLQHQLQLPAYLQQISSLFLEKQQQNQQQQYQTINEQQILQISKVVQNNILNPNQFKHTQLSINSYNNNNKKPRRTMNSNTSKGTIAAEIKSSNLSKSNRSEWVGNGNNINNGNNMGSNDNEGHMKTVMSQNNIKSAGKFIKCNQNINNFGNNNIYNGSIQDYNHKNIVYNNNNHHNGFEFRFNQNKKIKNMKINQNINLNSKSSINQHSNNQISSLTYKITQLNKRYLNNKNDYGNDNDINNNNNKQQQQISNQQQKQQINLQNQQQQSQKYSQKQQNYLELSMQQKRLQQLNQNIIEKQIIQLKKQQQQQDKNQKQQSQKDQKQQNNRRDSVI